MDAVNLALRLVENVCRAARGARRNKAAAARLATRTEAFEAVLRDLVETRGGPTPRQMQGVMLLGRVLEDAAALLEKMDGRSKVVFVFAHALIPPLPAARPKLERAVNGTPAAKRARAPAAALAPGAC